MTLRDHIATHTITRLSAAAQYGAEHGRQDARYAQVRYHRCGNPICDRLAIGLRFDESQASRCLFQ